MTRSWWRIEGMPRLGSRRAHSSSSTARTTSSPSRCKIVVWGLMIWPATSKNRAKEAQWARTTTGGSSKGFSTVLTGRIEITKPWPWMTARSIKIMLNLTKLLTEIKTSVRLRVIRITRNRIGKISAKIKARTWWNPPNTPWNQNHRGTIKSTTYIFYSGARARTELTAGRRIRMRRAKTRTEMTKLSSRRAKCVTRATRRRAGIGRMWMDWEGRRVRASETVSRYKTPCTTQPWAAKESEVSTTSRGEASQRQTITSTRIRATSQVTKWCTRCTLSSRTYSIRIIGIRRYRGIIGSRRRQKHPVVRVLCYSSERTKPSMAGARKKLWRFSATSWPNLRKLRSGTTREFTRSVMCGGRISILLLIRTDSTTHE